MPDISGVSNNTVQKTTTPLNSTGQKSAENGIMGKDDFLKLFLASLQHQDPLAPMETKDMMEQMSQLSLIEQITNMGKVVDGLSEELAEALAPDESTLIERGVNFIGKEITGLDTDGKKITGKVDEISIDKGNVSLLVNNKKVEISGLSRVADYSAYGLQGATSTLLGKTPVAE